MYLLKADLTITPNPKTYVNTFVNFTFLEQIRDLREKNDSDGLAALANDVLSDSVFASSDLVAGADYLRSEGNDVRWNTDMQIAEELRLNYSFKEEVRRKFRPRAGWESYLSDRYVESDDRVTTDGRVVLWKGIDMGVFHKYRPKEVFRFNGLGFEPDRAVQVLEGYDTFWLGKRNSSVEITRVC